MRRSLRRTFFRPERPTLTSRSLQSITRPFQKRFREVFGNARILIFYLSIKAWEEKSLPKSHLGWFLLVFDEGKAAKENISIFWFIWPLSLAPLGVNDCLCLTVRDTGILRCAGLVLQDLRFWRWSTGLSKKRLQGCASDSRIRLNYFLVKFWRLVKSDSTVSLGRPMTFRHLFCTLCRSSSR